MGIAANIKNGKPLTEHHEYAIESLWHEILHNRQTGEEALFNLDQRNPIRLLSETLNQYVSSRHSAPLGHLIDIQSYIFLLNSNIIFN